MSKKKPETTVENAPQDGVQTEKELAMLAEDRRGGNFFILDGKRIHETALTKEQREIVGLPPKEVVADA